MVKKMTIKELLDSVDKPAEVYKRFANEFTKDDIMYALSKGMDIISLIKHVNNKFDIEALNYYIKKYKNKVMDNNDDDEWLFRFLNENFKNIIDKEFIKYLIDKNKYIRDILKLGKDKFDKELIKYVIDKNINKKANLGSLYDYLRDKFDKELIKYAIDKNADLENLYYYLDDKFDKELIKYAIDKKADLYNLYYWLKDKFDDELKQLYREKRYHKK